MTTKTCPKCGETKPLDGFATAKHCRACQAAYRRAWYERNTEKAKQQARRWDGENRERSNELKRRWDQNNPELSRQLKRRYAESDHGKKLRRESIAAWRKRNPEKQSLIVWHSNHRRRGMFAPDTIAYVEVLRSDPCSYCGGPAGTVDHIEPACESEDNTPSNLTAACGTCNQRKNAKPLLAALLHLNT